MHTQSLTLKGCEGQEQKLLGIDQQLKKANGGTLSWLSRRPGDRRWALHAFFALVPWDIESSTSGILTGSI